MKYKEQYYNLTEEEMQDLITRAKSGDSRAQVEILEVFNNFLRKYVNLLYYSKYNLGDYDMRWFISMYVTKKAHVFGLKRNKLSKEGQAHVNEVVRGLQYMVQRYGDERDVTQTVNTAFFYCLNRYEKRGAIPFKGYLYRYFLFVLKKYVDEFLIDQLGRKTFPLIDESDVFGEDSSDEERPPGFLPPPTDYLEEMMNTEKIDEYWVIGDTSLPPFDVLTVQERQLLRWRYCDHYKANDIAHKITEHPNTLREHYTRIREKIKIAIAEELALDSID